MTDVRAKTEYLVHLLGKYFGGSLPLGTQEIFHEETINGLSCAARFTWKEDGFLVEIIQYRANDYSDATVFDHEPRVQDLEKAARFIVQGVVGWKALNSAGC